MAIDISLPTKSFEPIDHAKIAAAMELRFRDMLLEHARMGRSVCESPDGKIVWISPEEIFARYGLDANGKPLSKA